MIIEETGNRKQTSPKPPFMLFITIIFNMESSIGTTYQTHMKYKIVKLQAKIERKTHQGKIKVLKKRERTVF